MTKPTKRPVQMQVWSAWKNHLPSSNNYLYDVMKREPSLIHPSIHPSLSLSLVLNSNWATFCIELNEAPLVWKTAPIILPYSRPDYSQHTILMLMSGHSAGRAGPVGGCWWTLPCVCWSEASFDTREHENKKEQHRFQGSFQGHGVLQTSEENDHYRGRHVRLSWTPPSSGGKRVHRARVCM